ncbi:uncharacterized protein LOC103710699 isoform X2 [Phoenix dactylifera]|uniref:Uncharacterized protein LOC103710699 isoform X2 n=1 Tax=Phoenix dactylifera TaxID=42345 RepID=A0A8B7MUP2_PHODC|nr:uncharacterized protein LOC103710699 isoform X2 [Phoenix dactylifera]
MSLENEEQLVLESLPESISECRKQSKISYTKDFLLSLSDLDICKKLPSGFDASILSELEDASNSILERQRGLGGLPLQGSNHNDYASLPLNRWDGSDSYSRGSSGRWDTRSSGSSDRDGDFQSDRELFMQDADRRPGNPSRRFWQHPEHDGLLGSGAFPRHSESKARGSNHYQLNKSSEPYQPPRPYKAMPFPRKDSDFCNDETFGSAECSSQERAEEERKRRSSFELMRKEQQKALQEKQKHYNNKEKLDADIIALLESSVDKQVTMNGNDKSDDSLTSSLFRHDSSKSSFVPQAPASRPLVPPGFANALVEKSLSVQSSSTSLESEARSAVVGDKIPLDGMYKDQEKRNQSAVCMNANVQKSGFMNTSVFFVNESSSTNAEVVKPSIGFENAATMTSGLQKVSEVWEDDRVNDFSNEKEAKSEIVNTVGQDHSTSILEKLFGSALAKNYESSPTYVENQGLKTYEETWSPVVSESSKFARWFLEEEKNSVEEFSSRDLLSLIVNEEKVGLQTPAISNGKAAGHIPQSLAFENNELFTSPATSSIAGISEQYNQGARPDSSVVVLTCEDLEQSILAEVKDSSSTLRHSVQGAGTSLDGKSEDQGTNMDDHASQHLLSLLQKGTKNDATASPMLGMESYDRISISDVKTDLNLGGVENSTASNSERVPGSEKALMLEALFGAKSMYELHSVEAPVSVHRGSAGGLNDTEAPLSHGRPISHTDVFFSSSSGEYQSSKTVREEQMVTLNHIQEARGYNILGPGIDHRDSPTEGSKLGSAGAEEGALEIHLPEEDGLITGRLSLQLPHLMNQPRPLLQQLGQLANRNHDPQHPFPANVIPHHAFNNASDPRFDPAAHHLMLQHMPLPGNFPPQYPFQGIPRGLPLSHPINHMPGYLPEMGNVHNFPMPHHQPNNGGLGMGMPGAVAGVGMGGHPEALERLIEMEMRANSKQIHPAAAGHIPGIFGPDLDMNFRYR